MVKMSSLVNNIWKIRLFLFIFQILLSIDFIFCGNCKSKINLLDKACYNDLLTFNDTDWRAGHACTNKQNVTIVEFSGDNSGEKSRLFYGLKDNGRYYFSGGLKKIDTMSCHSCTSTHRGRFESRNILVSLKGGSSTKQYLFSMSSYYALAELIDIDDPNSINYHAWNTTVFFGLTHPIFSFEFSLFEIEETKTYIAAFIESAGTKKNAEGKDEEYSNTNTIVKFQFDSYASSDYRTIINKLTIPNTFDGRVVSAFRFDIAKRIILVMAFSNNNYVAYSYDDDLNYQNQISIYNNIKNIWTGYGLFIKGIALKNNHAALAFYTSGNSGSTLFFRHISYKADNDFNYPYDYTFSDYNFRQDVASNALYKLEDDRIVLCATSDYNSMDYGRLHMFLFDFYNNYAGVKIREYQFYYPNRRFAKEMAAYMYNGYILLTATLSDSNQTNIFASMMIFGFGNGTDHEIDISPYLMDVSNYNSTNNLFDYLMSKMVIDNNIFAYEKVEKIRLISICDELLLYRGKGSKREANTLPPNELFDANHTLLQNKALEKEENKLYTLEYQYMVKEPNFETFYDSAVKVKNVHLDGVNAQSFYKPKTLNGRVNILSFKLCHRYCIK